MSNVRGALHDGLALVHRGVEEPTAPVRNHGTDTPAGSGALRRRSNSPILEHAGEVVSLYKTTKPPQSETPGLVYVEIGPTPNDSERIDYMAVPAWVQERMQPQQDSFERSTQATLR